MDWRRLCVSTGASCLHTQPAQSLVYDAAAPEETPPAAATQALGRAQSVKDAGVAALLQDKDKNEAALSKLDSQHRRWVVGGGWWRAARRTLELPGCCYPFWKEGCHLALLRACKQRLSHPLPPAGCWPSASRLTTRWVGGSNGYNRAEQGMAGLGLQCCVTLGATVAPMEDWLDTAAGRARMAAAANTPAAQVMSWGKAAGAKE